MAPFFTNSKFNFFTRRRRRDLRLLLRHEAVLLPLAEVLQPRADDGTADKVGQLIDSSLTVK